MGHREPLRDRRPLQAGRELLSFLDGRPLFDGLGPLPRVVEHVETDHAPVRGLVGLDLEDLDGIALVEDGSDLHERTDVNPRVGVDR